MTSQSDSYIISTDHSKNSSANNQSSTHNHNINSGCSEGNVHCYHENSNSQSSQSVSISSLSASPLSVRQQRLSLSQRSACLPSRDNTSGSLVMMATTTASESAIPDLLHALQQQQVQQTQQTVDYLETQPLHIDLEDPSAKIPSNFEDDFKADHRIDADNDEEYHSPLEHEQNDNEHDVDDIIRFYSVTDHPLSLEDAAIPNRTITTASMIPDYPIMSCMDLPAYPQEASQELLLQQQQHPLATISAGPADLTAASTTSSSSSISHRRRGVRRSSPPVAPAAHPTVQSTTTVVRRPRSTAASAGTSESASLEQPASSSAPSGAVSNDNSISGLRASLDAGMAAIRRWIRSRPLGSTTVASPTSSSSNTSMTGNASSLFPPPLLPLSTTGARSARSVTWSDPMADQMSTTTNSLSLGDEDWFAMTFAGDDPRLLTVGGASTTSTATQAADPYPYDYYQHHHPTILEEDEDEEDFGRQRSLSEPDALRIRDYFLFQRIMASQQHRQQQQSTVINSHVGGNNESSSSLPVPRSHRRSMRRRRGTGRHQLSGSGHNSMSGLSGGGRRRRARSASGEHSLAQMARSQQQPSPPQLANTGGGVGGHRQLLSSSAAAALYTQQQQQQQQSRMPRDNSARNIQDQQEPPQTSIVLSQASTGTSLSNSRYTLEDGGLVRLGLADLVGGTDPSNTTPPLSGIVMSSLVDPGVIPRRTAVSADDSSSSSNSNEMADRTTTATAPGTTNTDVDPDRRARMRWFRINRRFQFVITVVALVFSLLLFAILICWVVLTSAYVVSFDKSCDVPLKSYFWLVTLQLVLDVFRSDIMRFVFQWDANSNQRIPCRVIVYNVSYLLYALLVLRLGMRSVFGNPDSTCRATAPELFNASTAFVSLSIAAWTTIVCGYLLPFCVVAALLTYNGYNPSSSLHQDENGGTTTSPVFPAAYSASGAPPGCVDQLPVIRMDDFPEEYPHECCICMEEFNRQDIVVETFCKHIFHKQCCRDWLRQARTCPVCRTDIPSHLNIGIPSDDTEGTQQAPSSRIPLGPTGRPVVGLFRMLQQRNREGSAAVVTSATVVERSHHLTERADSRATGASDGVGASLAAVSSPTLSAVSVEHGLHRDSVPMTPVSASNVLYSR